MATKTLDSNSKRKAEEDVKKEADLSGDELLSSLVTKKPKPNKKPQGSNKNANPSKKEEAVEENENGAAYVFPMNRVTRIAKSDNSHVKLSAEAAFLFNKASVYMLLLSLFIFFSFILQLWLMIFFLFVFYVMLCVCSNAFPRLFSMKCDVGYVAIKFVY